MVFFEHQCQDSFSLQADSGYYILGPGHKYTRGLPYGASIKQNESHIKISNCKLCGLGRFPGGWNGNPLQYSRLENPMDRGAWRATVHGVTKSQTWLHNNNKLCSVQWRKVGNVLCYRIMGPSFRWERTKKGLSEQVSLKLSIDGWVRVKKRSSIPDGGNNTKRPEFRREFCECEELIDIIKQKGGKRLA